MSRPARAMRGDERRPTAIWAPVAFRLGMARDTFRAWTAVAFAVAGYLSMALWIGGVALHDRFGWSQWLSWIPAPAMLVALLVASVCVRWLRGPSGRAHARVLGVGAVAAAVWTVHACLGWTPAPEGRHRSVRLLQWNTDWPSADDPRSAAALASAPADIVLNSNPGDIMRADALAAWAPEGARAHFAGPFALVTAWPVTEARSIAAGGWGRQMWYVSRFVVMPPGWNGVPLRIAMVDLPSRPTLAKRQIADALAQACAAGALGEIDIVAGDFNAIDGSVILTRCFPAHRDALAESGRGWLCTWPRAFPLWKIDHVLLGSGLRALQAHVIDPGTSHHRMTQVDVEPR